MIKCKYVKIIKNNTSYADYKYSSIVHLFKILKIAFISAWESQQQQLKLYRKIPLITSVLIFVYNHSVYYTTYNAQKRESIISALIDDNHVAICKSDKHRARAARRAICFCEAGDCRNHPYPQRRRRFERIWSRTRVGDKGWARPWVDKRVRRAWWCRCLN